MEDTRIEDAARKEHLQEEHVTHKVKTYKIGKLFPVLVVLLLVGGSIGTIWSSNMSEQKSVLKSKAGIVVSPPMQLPNGKTKIMMSGLDGSIVIREIDGKTWVNVNLPTHGEDSEGDKDYPLTIQSGTCANPGLVKFALTSIDDGGSETFLSVSVADLRNLLPLSVVAHASASDPTSVSCGDISVIYD